MIARGLLALILCPGLGILSGGWLAQQVTTLARATQPSAGEAGTAPLFGMDLLCGAAGGCVVGLLFALTLIWCARRGPGSAQRAFADLLLIGLALLFLVDWVTYIGLVPRAAELWASLLPVNVVVWLLGLALSVVAMRKARRVRRMAEAGV
jgi:hypothetical protein